MTLLLLLLGCGRLDVNFPPDTGCVDTGDTGCPSTEGRAGTKP